MTKQEEIRKGIGDFLWKIYKRRNWIYHHPDREEFLRDTVTGELIDYLHSQGVVIKVDREFPNPYVDTHIWRDYTPNMAYEKSQQDMLQAGYVAVELLIGEAVQRRQHGET